MKIQKVIEALTNCYAIWASRWQTLVLVMAYCWFGTKPLLQPMQIYQFDAQKMYFSHIQIKMKIYPLYTFFENSIRKKNHNFFFQASMRWNIFDGSVQDCSNSIADALESLQSCTEPWISICLPTFKAWHSLLYHVWCVLLVKFLL